MRFFDFLLCFNRRSLKKKANKDCISNSASSKNDIVFGSTSGAISSTEHRYENGRRFHNDENAVYLLPNDVEEDDRIHLQHWAIKLAFGSNFDAPIQQALEDGTNVLDSACGPGTWILEMAHTYPNSKFYGTDISPRFPTQIKPGNCEFLVQNIVEEPPFQENYFGYIHQRLVILGIKTIDWPKVLENLKLTLKPGGWAELTEFSHYHAQNTGPNMQFGLDLGIKMMLAAGLDPDLGSHLPTLLSDAGFTNIQIRRIDVPVNHGGKMGELFWQDYREAAYSGKPIYCKLRPELEEPGAFEQCLNDIGEECRINKWTMQWTRVFAQKPLSSNN